MSTNEDNVELRKKIALERMVGKKVWVIKRETNYKDGGYFGYVNKVVDTETVSVRGIADSGDVSIWDIRSYEDLTKEETDKIYPSVS